MEQEHYISLREFCQGHALDETFLFRLEAFELIRIERVRSEACFHREELPRLERLIRLHRDLDIGPQGLQAIDHLLGRMQRMQDEMAAMRRRLDRWE